MKRMKKIFAVLLAIVMVLAWNITSLADTNSNTNYSITINNAALGETYTAYKLFEVSNSGDNYSYYINKGNESLKSALEGLGLTFTTSADGSRYIVNQKSVTEGETTTVTFVGNNNSTIDAATLAADLNTEIQKTESALKTALTSAGSATAAEGENEEVTATISLAGPGYYFVDSSLGSLCMLNTAVTTVTINEKNSQPTITKQVWEDSVNNGSGAYQDAATIDVIDTVKYQLTVNTGTNDNGTGTGVDDDYTIVDTLPVGITYKTAPGVVVSTVEADATEEEGSETTVTWLKDTDYTVSYDATARKITITLLSGGKLKDLAQNTDITITYEASVTASSVAYGHNAGNVNTVELTYKRQESSATATVYTHEIGGENFVKQNSSSEALSGVTFILSKGSEEAIQYAKLNSDGYLTGWTSNKDEATPIITDENGQIKVLGLDADTYVITETATLDGYNLLDDTITVVIAEDGAITYKLTKDTKEAGNSITVINQTGAELPETGGMGTKLFYILGAVLVIGAGVLLVVRRRMNAEK